MKKIITILMLLMMPAVFAADACNNEYASLSFSSNTVSYPTWETPTDSASNVKTVAAYSTVDISNINFATKSTPICDDQNVYSSGDFSIDWTLTDGYTNSNLIAYTNEGKIAVIGPEYNDNYKLNINFYNPDGTIVSSFQANFGDAVAYDMVAAAYPAGGVVLAVLTEDNGYLYVYHIKSTGQVWTDAFDLNIINGFPLVYSNNNNFAVAISDNTQIYALLFDISDGSKDSAFTETVASNALRLKNLYLDSSGSVYIAAEYTATPAELIFNKVTAGAEVYERKLSSDTYATTNDFDIIECGSYLCLAANFVTSNSIFKITPSTGVVNDEIQYDTSISPNDIAYSENNLYVTGTESYNENFASSLDLVSDSVNWNKYYDTSSSPPALTFASIDVGQTIVGIAANSYSGYRVVVVGLSKSTGSVMGSAQINIEGQSNYVNTPDIEYIDPVGFVFTVSDAVPMSGYTGLFDIDSDGTGLVPEFSITTLLLATLLVGGLVLFVVRRRYK